MIIQIFASTGQPVSSDVPAEITTHGSFGNNLGSPARIQVRRRPRPQRRGDAQGQSRQPRPNRSRRRAGDKRRHRDPPYNMEQQPTRAGDGAPRVLVKSSESNCIPSCGTLRSGSPERGSMNQNIRFCTFRHVGAFVCRIQCVADLATPAGYTPRSLEHPSPPTCSRRAFLQRKAWIEIRTPPASSR